MRIIMEAIEQYVIDKVWKMRSEKGWSLQELADYMNVSKGFLANVESKKELHTII
jgi:transcriptional regulator with XRE-family HTH domain